MFRSAMRPPNQPSTFVNDAENCISSDRAAAVSAEDVEVDNSHHVLLKIATLYADKLMNDISLIVGGIEYPAHRLILCASSDVFQVMLMNPQWSESHESRVVLQETPACAEIFGQFLRYFYTGQIKINHKIVTPLLALSDKYNVKDLTNLCIEYMCSHIALAASNNQLVTWFQYTLSIGHHIVAYVCQNFLKWNFELVAKSKDFANCTHEILSKLLQWNDLVVTNEITLYNYAVVWLEHQRQTLIEEGLTGDNLEFYMKNLVQEIMSHIRFPMMTPRQLAELLLSPLTTKYKEFFIERMAIGMAFHSDQRERVLEVARSEAGKLQFTPRLYTADTFSSTLCVDNFSSMPFYQTRTLVFSSHSGLAEHMGDKPCDWVIDLYPKGVWFPKCFLIVWQGTVELPESILCSVRLSITCRDVTEDYLRVKIGVLIVGLQDGTEHVVNVVEKNHYFSKDDRVLNIDNIIPFDDLNLRLIKSDGHKRPPYTYLVGLNKDCLKVHIVIAPLSDVSSIEPQKDYFFHNRGR
ncbi:BTB/POZ domain-containing protein 17 isoform X2 [Cimex lectularius]|nr:BTB/POZ domain-containing protein 17 isoform X2 [Cimex lectularius]XP_014252512.1 BTB/POZ domain-containing protein 17 isoform X2 [Cimex lectularius]